MNNNHFRNNIPKNLNKPNKLGLLPPGMNRCGVDMLKIKPRAINLNPVKHGNNNGPTPPQQNPNVNMVNNNIMYNNFNNNVNHNLNNNSYIQPKLRDFY